MFGTPCTNVDEGSVAQAGQIALLRHSMEFLMALARKLASTVALLLLLVAQPAFAYPAINLDLSYVDKHSVQYQRFKEFVDRAVAGDPGYGFSATDAAYMYKLTGQKPYGKLAVDLVDQQVSAAEAAIASGHLPDIADDSYLNVGPMLMSLSLTYDWCEPLLTPTQKTRWTAYADQAVSNVWSPFGASWGGRPTPRKGWAVNDPGDNYFYSFVQATMYWALASNNAKLKAFLQDDRLPMLEKYFATLPGGGSREGTSYGASVRALFALYRLWRDATGTDLANANSHLTDTIYYWIHATVPTLDRFAPIGDQPRVSVPELYDYERQLMLEARKLTNNAAAAEAASWWLHQISINEMTNGFNFRHDLLPAGDKGTPPTPLIYHATGVGQLFARTSWDKSAMWLDFSAGPYEQSHAHQDQGAFTLFAGDWLAVTENIWSHSGIQQGTETNNVVRFERNGEVVRQVAPTLSTLQMTATGAKGEVHASADLTPAYDGNSAVQSWQRSIDFVDRTLTVHDTYKLGEGTQAIFQVNVPAKPTINGNTATAGHLKMTVVSPANATLSAVDWTTVNPDYTSGWRIDVRGPGNQFVVTFTTDLSARD
jgi:hypothetical protein